jgi:hypothetical protein
VSLFGHRRALVLKGGVGLPHVLKDLILEARLPAKILQREGVENMLHTDAWRWLATLTATKPLLSTPGHDTLGGSWPRASWTNRKTFR